MIESVETVKDVEKQLAEARAKLQAFEDGVDRGRLLQRLKLASPAHPVLLFRMLFLALMVTALGVALTVLAVPFVNPDLARRIARFDAVVPAPAGVPALPAFLGLLALCMLVGWFMTTLAALAMGRDAQMLPWEQKQHQKLVNEVTRLTTQKAVMERMRSTPAGARPRIDTPVPVSLRDRSGMTPSALGRLGESGTPAPAGIGSMQGRFGTGPASGAGGNPFGRAPGSAAPGAEGGGLFGRAPGTLATPAGATRAGDAPTNNPFASPAAAAPTGGGGVLARARSGSLKTTPAGAAGRLTPNFNRSSGAGSSAGEEGGDDEGPFARSGGPAPSAATNPFGAAAPARAGNPFGSGGATGNPFGKSTSNAPQENGSGASAFGTPPALGAVRPGAGLLSKARAASSGPDIVEGAGYSAESAIPDSDSEEGAGVEGRNVRPPLPKWGAIDDTWLEDALQRVEDLSRDLPLQAHLRFSEEAYLPFTLVLARATPPVAVKALVAFADYLASIPTPPRARVELSGSPGLDRSFHRNVEATLVPMFGEAVEVEQEPGRVEVVFKQPDPAWQDYPDLPIQG